MQLTPDDFQRLEQMDRDSNAKVRESDFVKRLLPHLIRPEDGSADRRVDIYVAAAGNPTRMIDVVSDSDPKVVLFTVPPLISPTPMAIRSIHARPETDIGELAAEFEVQITTSHPGGVIEGFVQRLLSLNYTPADAISTVYAKMWAMIYKRYNIPLERMFGADAALVEQELGGAVSAVNDAPQKKGTELHELDEDDFEPM